MEGWYEEICYFTFVSISFSYLTNTGKTVSNYTSILKNYANCIAYLLPISKTIEIKIEEVSYYTGYPKFYNFIIDLLIYILLIHEL